MAGKSNDPPGPAIPPFLAARGRPDRLGPGSSMDLALSKLGFDGQRAAGAKPIVTSTYAGGGGGPSTTSDLALARRDWLANVQEEQRRLSPLAGGLLRCDGMESQQFLDHFYAPGRPCIIDGLIADWPALSRWTPDYLRAIVGDAPVEFQGGRTGAADFELAKDRHKQRAQFGEYLDLVLGQGGNDAYITAYNSAANSVALAPLMSDTRPIPALLTPGDGMLWIGPAGTFTPLHFDLTNNLLVQVTGRKELLLVPPADTRHMAHHRHVFSDVHDLEDESQLTRHPQARKVRPFRVLLEPGMALFIPIGWWHQVRARDFSVMLTYTNFVWPNDGHREFPADR